MTLWILLLENLSCFVFCDNILPIYLLCVTVSFARVTLSLAFVFYLLVTFLLYTLLASGQIYDYKSLLLAFSPKCTTGISILVFSRSKSVPLNNSLILPYSSFLFYYYFSSILSILLSLTSTLLKMLCF